jgi:hypothetical protein
VEKIEGEDRRLAGPPQQRIHHPAELVGPGRLEFNHKLDILVWWHAKQFSEKDIMIFTHRWNFIRVRGNGQIGTRVCRMDLPRPTISVGTRTDYSVGPGTTRLALHGT